MVRGYDFVKFGGYLGNICLYFHRSLVLDNVVPRFLTPLRKIGIFGFYQTMNNIWKLPANITDIFISSLYFILDLKPKLTSLLLRVFVSPFYLILPFVEAGGTTYVRPDGLSDVSLKVKRLFFVSFFTGLVFTGVLTPIISAFTGTLLPSNSAFSYLEDKYNIILYIVVCPAYIALGSIIVYCTVEFQKIPLIKNLINEPRPKFLHGKTGHVIWIALSFLLAIIVSANYQHDVFSLNNSFTNKDDIYWFFTEDRGRIYFNFAGYFYIYLNFLLLLITIITVIFYCSSAFSLIYLSSKIKDGLFGGFDEARKELNYFIFSFLVAKYVFLVYIINVYIWNMSPLGNVENVKLAVLAFSVIGTVLVPLPLKIFESRWFNHERARYLRREISDRPDMSSLVPAGWARVFKIFPIS